jgi:hypothetical protein
VTRHKNELEAVLNFVDAIFYGDTGHWLAPALKGKNNKLCASRFGPEADANRGGLYCASEHVAPSQKHDYGEHYSHYRNLPCDAVEKATVFRVTGLCHDDLLGWKRSCLTSIFSTL